MPDDTVAEPVLRALRRPAPTTRVEGRALASTRYEINVLVDDRILVVPIDAIIASEVRDRDDPTLVSLTVADPWRITRADGVAKPDPNWDPPTIGGIRPRPGPGPDPMPEVHVQFVGADGYLYQIPSERLRDFLVEDERIWPLPMSTVADGEDGGSRPTCEDTKDTGMMGCAR